MRRGRRICPVLRYYYLEIMFFKKQHSLYESEHTKFIKELKAKTPGMEERQVEGRSLLWDKAPLSLDEQERIEQSRLRQQAYPYQNKV